MRYVLVGGYAATIHQIPIAPTTDVDIAPSCEIGNLQRLVRALEDLGATNLLPEVTGSATPPFFADPGLISGRRFWTLVTPFGALDLVVGPDGFPNGYADLTRHAVRRFAIRPDGTQIDIVVDVASATAIYQSKKAAGRPKDRKALPALAQAMRIELKRKSK